MALPDFPNNPTLNEQFTVGTNIYQWDGEKWKALSNADNSLRSQLADVESTVLVGGVEAKDIAKRYSTPEQFGAVGDGLIDDTAAVQQCLDSLRPTLLSKNYAVTSLSVPVDKTVVSNNAILTRLSSFSTEDVDLLTVNSNVHLEGKLTVNGSDKDLVSDLVNVVGDNVVVDILFVKDILKDSGNSHGVVVRGDNFSANEVRGSRSGYATLRLFPSKAISSFNVERLLSFEHFNKGFVLNGLQEFGHVRIGSYFGRYTGTDAGTDHILVDTQADPRVFNVKNLTIGQIDAEGAEANGAKIENVENCVIGSARFRNEPNSDPARSSIRMSAKKFTCDSLDVDVVASITCDSSYIGNYSFAENLPTYSTYAIQYIGASAGISGIVSNKLDNLICPDHPATGGFVRVQYPSDTRDVFLEITTITSPDERPINLTSANTPDNFAGGSSVLIKTLNGYTGIGYAGSSARDTRVQIGSSRRYRAFSKPSSGSFKLGDIVYSSNPSGLGFLGWVAVSDIPDATVDASDLQTFGAIVP